MNNVSIIGRLGRDPELRYTQSGKAVCNLRVALDNGKDRDATWVDVVCWDRTAELVSQYLTKGRQVGVEGRLAESNWTDRDGNERRKIEVVAFRVHFLGSGGDRQQDGGSGGGYGSQRPQQGGNQQPYADDDVPF